jgi:hypothetical protein
LRVRQNTGKSSSVRSIVQCREGLSNPSIPDTSESLGTSSSEEDVLFTEDSFFQLEDEDELQFRPPSPVHRVRNYRNFQNSFNISPQRSSTPIRNLSDDFKSKCAIEKQPPKTPKENVEPKHHGVVNDLNKTTDLIEVSSAPFTDILNHSTVLSHRAARTADKSESTSSWRSRTQSKTTKTASSVPSSE